MNNRNICGGAWQQDVGHAASGEHGLPCGEHTGGLGARALGKISGTASILRRGDFLYHRGCDDRWSTILDDGWIGLQFDVEEGHHCIVDFCLPGEILGLSQPIGSIVPHAAICLTGVSVRVVRRDELLAMAAISDELGKFLCRCAVSREYRAYDHLANLAARDTRRRVAHLMLELYCRATHRKPQRTGDQMAMPLRLSDIAEAVGLSPVHVSRTLRILRDNNIVDVRARKMTVGDPAKWRRLAGEFLLPLADPFGADCAVRRQC